MRTSDAQLVQSVRDGDTEAFGALVDRHRDMAYGMAYHLTGDFEAARDLAQEAFIQAFTKLDQLHEPDKFAAWLRKILLNCQRMQRRTREVATVPFEDQQHRLPEDRTVSERDLTLRDALKRLREPDRLALTLHYINGYSHADIAGFLDVRPETIKTRLARARHRLKEEALKMAQEMFESNALPAEFRENVVASVKRLVQRMRSAVLGDLDEINSRVGARRNAAWSRVLSTLPAGVLRRAGEKQEPVQIVVSDLGEDCKQDVREAMCYTWIHWALGSLATDLPWVSDFDVLWVQLHREQHGRRFIVLANAPWTQGGSFSGAFYSDIIPAGPNVAVRKVSQGSVPDDLETRVALCNVPEEIRQAIDRIGQAIPGKSGALRDAIYVEMARVMRDAREQLPAEAKATMDSGTCVSVRSLPERVREVLRKAVALHWGFGLFTLVQCPPAWLTDFEGSRVEFGPWGNLVKLCPPDAKKEETFQTGIPGLLDGVADH